MPITTTYIAGSLDDIAELFTQRAIEAEQRAESARKQSDRDEALFKGATWREAAEILGATTLHVRNPSN